MILRGFLCNILRKLLSAVDKYWCSCHLECADCLTVIWQISISSCSFLSCKLENWLDGSEQMHTDFLFLGCWKSTALHTYLIWEINFLLQLLYLFTILAFLWSLAMICWILSIQKFTDLGSKPRIWACKDYLLPTFASLSLPLCRLFKPNHVNLVGIFVMMCVCAPIFFFIHCAVVLNSGVSPDIPHLHNCWILLKFLEQFSYARYYHNVCLCSNFYPKKKPCCSVQLKIVNLTSWMKTMMSPKES